MAAAFHDCCVLSLEETYDELLALSDLTEAVADIFLHASAHVGVVEDGVDNLFEILGSGAAVGVVDISQVIGRDKVTIIVSKNCLFMV